MSTPKIALVIGASSGYGLAIASNLLDQGYQVLTAQRRPCPDARATSAVLDLTNTESINELSHRLSDFRFDAIIYAAGCAAPIVPQSHKSIDEIERIVQVNALSLVRCIKHFAPTIADKGAFVYLSSISETKNYHGGAEYCASKAFAASYIRAMRLEYLRAGIRFCNVAPGMGDTDFHQSRGSDPRTIGGAIRKLRPDDVARAVSFVLSQPPHVCISHIVVTPTDQAEHGHDINNLP